VGVITIFLMQYKYLFSYFLNNFTNTIPLYKFGITWKKMLGVLVIQHHMVDHGHMVVNV